MFEHSVERVFQQMADQEQPPSRVSIQQALRNGRTRLRRRRLIRAVGTPVLAAAAVLAVALPVSMSAGSYGAGQKQGPTSATAHRFRALAPYATFDWLPAKEPVARGQQTALAQLNTWGTIDRTLETLDDGAWVLSVYAAGTCHQAGTQIDCPSDQLVPGQPKVPVQPCGSDKVQASPVNGHQAFWAAGQGLETVSNGSNVRALTHLRCLTWEYAPGGWASLRNFGEINPDKQLVVRIASRIRFGGRQASFKFAAQFRNLPGKWRVVLPASFYLMRRVGHELLYMGVEHGALLVQDFAITDGATTLNVDVNVFPSKHSQCVTGKPGCRVINGYHVSVSKLYGTQQLQISAPDADNLYVALGTVSQQHLGLLFSVFSHLTMLGRNPAAWTTQPIATPSASASPQPTPSTSTSPLPTPS
jgi:hypothetical protein